MIWVLILLPLFNFDGAKFVDWDYDKTRLEKIAADYAADVPVSFHFVELDYQTALQAWRKGLTDHDIKHQN